MFELQGFLPSDTQKGEEGAGVRKKKFLPGFHTPNSWEVLRGMSTPIWELSNALLWASLLQPREDEEE